MKKEHPIHYTSRTLTKYEINYGITDLERTVLHYCLTKSKPYNKRNPIQTIIYTDYKPLEGLFNKKE